MINYDGKIKKSRYFIMTWSFISGTLRQAMHPTVVWQDTKESCLETYNTSCNYYNSKKASFVAHLQTTKKSCLETYEASYEYCAKNKVPLVAGATFLGSFLSAWYIGPVTLASYTTSTAMALVLASAATSKAATIAQNHWKNPLTNDNQTQMVTPLLSLFNQLYHNTPTNNVENLPQATLQELLIKDPKTYSLNDYQSLISHLVTSYQDLLGLSKPDQNLLSQLTQVQKALDPTSEENLQKALDSLMDCLRSLPTPSLPHPAVLDLTLEILQATKNYPCQIKNDTLDKAWARACSLFKQTLYVNWNDLSEVITYLKQFKDDFIPKDHPLQTKMQQTLANLKQRSSTPPSPASALLSQIQQVENHLPIEMVKKFDIAYQTSLKTALQTAGFDFAHAIEYEETPGETFSQLSYIATAFTTLSQEKGLARVDSQNPLENITEIVDFILEQQN